MTKQERIDFLRELKADINEYTEFSCTYPLDEDIDNFIWVGTKDARIGNSACHYEVIFYARGEGVRTDVPFVEVHFESATYKNFQGIELPEWLAYEDWDKRKESRIVYTDDGGSRLSNVAIIERLRKLDKHIGKDLRAAFDSQIPKANTKNKNAIENARAYAGDKCEICADHESFVTGSDRNYTEAHHLIPTANQADFENSLDQEQNIVCLCSNCHNAIHYGADKHSLVEELWNQRKTRLKAAGIGITLSDLKAYYP